MDLIKNYLKINSYRSELQFKDTKFEQIERRTDSIVKVTHSLQIISDFILPFAANFKLATVSSSSR